MNPLFQRLMQQATRLTRKGDLRAATAAIKAALTGNGGAPGTAAPPTATAAANDPNIIDVPGFEVPQPPAAPASELRAEPGLEDAQPRMPVAPGVASVEPPADQDETSVEAPAAPVQPRRERPTEGKFIAGRYACNAGARDYKLFIPPQSGDRALPLVVMLHGCTQGPDDFAAGTTMNEAGQVHGFFVLYPAQSPQANPQRCWNWFKHNHQARGRGEPEILAGMTREIMERYPVDPARVYVAGLSAGGAMAAIMGDAYPDLFAAVGVHSGLATGIAKDMPSAFGAMKGKGARPTGTASGVPTIVFHGDADATVHPGNGEHVIAASAGSAGGEVETGYSAGGRSYSRAVHRNASGTVVAEHWVVHGAQHAWSGGSPKGSYADPRGPDATGEMVRFFMEHPHRKLPETAPRG